MKGTGFCSALSCGYLLFHHRHLRHQLLQLPQMSQRLLATRSDPVTNDLALHSLGQPVLDGEIALYVKLGVLAMAEYWWFTGINHRVTERTEDELTETTICLE